MFMPIKIQKRQGGYDEWSDDKIITSIMRAGATSDEAKQTADSVKAWTADNSEDGRIDSTQLRDQIIKQLKKLNPIAANTYQLYKK